MRHGNADRKLGVTPHHRRALIRSLALALIEQEQIKITPSRAKALRGFADQMITLAKRGDLHGRRRIFSLLGSTETTHPGENRTRNAIERIYTELVPRFKSRNGGYTQVFRLVERRPGDNAEQCIMRYIPSPEEKKEKKAPADAKAKKSAKKQVEAAPVDKQEVKKEKKVAKAPVEDKAEDKKVKKTKGK